MHVRSSAALDVFSFASLVLLFTGVLGVYHLNPVGAVPFAVVIVGQQVVAIKSFRVGTKAGGLLTLLDAIRVRRRPASCNDEGTADLSCRMHAVGEQISRNKACAALPQCLKPGQHFACLHF